MEIIKYLISYLGQINERHNKYIKVCKFILKKHCWIKPVRVLQMLDYSGMSRENLAA